MAKTDKHNPVSYQGVMVSSTFEDLERHRAALSGALRKQELFAVVMEDSVPGPADDVLSSSIGMVRKSSAYVGLISHRYGQIPACEKRNPHGYSITRLEFEEAQELGLPTLVFIMGKNHLVKPGDVETDDEKRGKLEDFRQRAEKGRIYETFESLEEFTEKAIHAVARLRRYMEEQSDPVTAPAEAVEPDVDEGGQTDYIPAPPEFYAEPPYLGSHDFVGRRAQLETLSDWAAPADAHPVFLFEAIGGSGKSMLTWEWVNNHVTRTRPDWSGRFWYSFYEKGAIMAGFCRHALAYMTGEPLDEFYKKKTPELAELMLRQLRSKSWLVVLDGLERVLVAYQRIDAAQITDEEAGSARDIIANRDPCDAIRPEDDELLRTLAGAAPSKLLLTSRLVPRALINSAGQPVPGVLRERLPGLRPPDAEALLRASGITGNSENIQDYLKRHCDGHPLVTGILAGLINDYFPDRGNFDAWFAAPEGGGRPNLAELDLVGKRNHILEAALAALPEKSYQLLATLALLSEAVDYPTLCALNPHLPPEPDKVEKPANPEKGWRWRTLSEDQRAKAKSRYQTELQRWNNYEQALRDRLASSEYLAAPGELQKTVRDLENRGLLQYDRRSKRHDLHPVIRGIVAGRLEPEETERLGQSVVDHFSRQTHNPYEQAETLEDLAPALQLIRTLLRMGRFRQAYTAYGGDVCDALVLKLEARAEVLSLLRPFFPKGWRILPVELERHQQGYLANEAANALECVGEHEEAFAANATYLQAGIAEDNWKEVRIALSNRANYFGTQNRTAMSNHLTTLSLDLATHLDDDPSLFMSRLSQFSGFARMGRWTKAEAIWREIGSMGRDWPRNLYQPGDAEFYYARFRFWRGKLSEGLLSNAEHLARAGNNRWGVRLLHGLRGEWLLEQGRYQLAAESLQEALRMARESGLTSEGVESQLALARFRHGKLHDPRQKAVELEKYKQPFHRGLAELWLAIGDRQQAKKNALAAYEWAWADGEPYVFRYELDKARTLLEELGLQPPDLTAYDPAKEEKLLYEDEIRAAIEKLKAKNQAKKSQGEK